MKKPEKRYFSYEDIKAGCHGLEYWAKRYHQSSRPKSQGLRAKEERNLVEAFYETATELLKEGYKKSQTQIMLEILRGDPEIFDVLVRAKPKEMCALFAEKGTPKELQIVETILGKRRFDLLTPANQKPKNPNFASDLESRAESLALEFGGLNRDSNLYELISRVDETFREYIEERPESAFRLLSSALRAKRGKVFNGVTVLQDPEDQLREFIEIVRTTRPDLARDATNLLQQTRAPYERDKEPVLDDEDDDSTHPPKKRTPREKEKLDDAITGFILSGTLR